MPQYLNIQCLILYKQTAESYGESKKVLGSAEGSNEHRVLDLMKQSPCLRLRRSISFLSAFVLSNSFEA